MKNKSPFCFFVALLMLWPLFAGCYVYLNIDKKEDLSFLRQPTKEHLENLKCDSQDQQKQNYFEKLICNSQSKLKQDNNFTHILPEDCRFVGEGLDDKKNCEALAGELLLRFVWFSDVHIRQRELKVWSTKNSRRVDSLILGAERNRVQEDFHWAVYLSQMEAVNKLHQEKPVDFMIHTGDSADIGTIEELYQFIYISNQLKIPWLNVVGNHDVTILGNYKARFGYGRDRDAIIYPIGNLGDFIWMNRKERSISGIGRSLLPVPSNSYHKPSIEPNEDKKLPHTFYHGFDWMWKCDKECKGPEDCGELPCKDFDYDEAGDYAIDLRTKDPHIRLIVINSSRKEGMGYTGAITEPQREWLKCMLLPAGRGINLVFAHHGSADYEDDVHDLLLGAPANTLADTIASPKNREERTLVLFTGHYHMNRLFVHAGSEGRKLYELNTSSLIQYPQIGRLIELRRTPNGEVYLISRGLWNSYMELVQKLVRNKEMPSKKDTHEFLEKCEGPNRNSRMENLEEAVPCGQYGAYADYLNDRPKWWAFVGRPQRVDQEMWDATNMIILIKSQKDIK